VIFVQHKTLTIEQEEEIKKRKKQKENSWSETLPKIKNYTLKFSLSEKRAEDDL